jgi:PilZ domain-containing protein
MWSFKHFSTVNWVSLVMEKREHPRIQIPLLVELIHPAIGTVQTNAKDISEGGLFVYLANPKVREGGKIKLRVLTTLPTDTQSKPTIDMQVKRVTEEGLGLAFINKTAQHLWSSVQQPRQELVIGRDYFQVHLSLAVLNDKKGILLVQENGKWLLPGRFLIVGESSEKALRDFAESGLGLPLSSSITPDAADSTVDVGLSEAATYSVIYKATTTVSAIELPKQGQYRDWRWLNRLRDLREITFAIPFQRTTAEALIKQSFEN